MSRLGSTEIKHLRALVAVADHGSFGRAADQLGYTQSAISQQIASFERSTGTPLFDRPGGPVRVTLTPSGATILPHARAILARLDTADDALDQLLAGESGEIRLGTFQSVSVRMLPEIVTRLRAERPGLEVRLSETDEDDVVFERIVDGELDLAFIVDPTTDPRVEVEELCRDPFVAISAAEWDLPKVLRPAHLGRYPHIGQPQCRCADRVTARLRGMGVEPDYVFVSSDNGAVQAMVRAQLGIAVMPWLTIDPNDPGIRVHEIDPPVKSRSIGLMHSATRTLAPGAERFVAIAREVAAAVHPSR